MLRACCERVAKMLQTQLLATSNIMSLSFPPMLRPCCDYITTMLRPVLRATSNIRSLFPLLLNTTPNTTCLQHRNATSATLKKMFATPNNTCLQHRDSASATSKINVCNIKNMRKEFQHPQHLKTNSCNIWINIHNPETSRSNATSTRNTCNILNETSETRGTHACNMHQILPHVVSPRPSSRAPGRTELCSGRRKLRVEEAAGTPTRQAAGELRPPPRMAARQSAGSSALAELHLGAAQAESNEGPGRALAGWMGGAGEHRTRVLASAGGAGWVGRVACAVVGGAREGSVAHAHRQME
jgi:hypothetical protein